MTAYVIVEVDVHDTGLYREYIKQAPPVITAFGGQYRARGGEAALLEGEEPPKRVVILEFESLDRAKQWHASEEYRQAKALRQSAATTRMIVVEGV